MKIITIMNYDNEPHITMCKIWIYLAKRHNPKAHIHVFHDKAISSIQKYAHNFTHVYFHTLTEKKNRTHNIHNGYIDHPTQDLQLNLWIQIEKMHLHKFIYVDADAFILSSLQPWWNIISDKPYIAINERRIKNHMLFNAGVFSYCSNDSFITYNKLYKQYLLDHKRIRYPAGQQGILNSHFAHTKYDWTHPQIDHAYNGLTKYCDVREINTKSIKIYSGRFPWRVAISNFLHNRKNPWWVDWVGWKKRKQIKILHAFGKGNKFWELHECAELWSYCVGAVS